MSDEPKKLSLSLKRAEMEVILADPDTNADQTYTLRELTGKDRDVFMNNMATRLRVGADGKPIGVKNVTDLQATLINMSLYGPDGQRVPIKVIGEWPASTQQALFEEAQRLSGLEDKNAEDNAKNG